MATKYRFEGKHKSFDKVYVYCEQCEWNGIPNQKIVSVYLGLRPANEDGFIHKFEEYDYSTGTRKKLHKHKYDKKVINQLVGEMLSRTKRCSQ